MKIHPQPPVALDEEIALSPGNDISLCFPCLRTFSGEKEQFFCWLLCNYSSKSLRKSCCQVVGRL